MPDKMYHWLEDFPRHFTHAAGLANSWELPVIKPRSSVVFLGIGGSAIGADLICGLFKSGLKVPTAVLRGEEIPAWFNSESLAVAVSYSGETRETLTAFHRILATGAAGAAISSGGTLMKLADEQGIPHLLIPSGIAPRSALCYTSVPLLRILQAAGVLTPEPLEPSNLQSLLENLRAEWSDSSGVGAGVGRRLLRRLPFIVGLGLSAGVARRFQAQLAENAKALSVVFDVPEALHNLVETMDASYLNASQPIVVYLDDMDAEPRERQMMKAIREAFQKAGLEGLPILSQGDTPLERMYSLIYKTDWISYHLAQLRGVDPVAIPVITSIKTSLT